MEDGRTIIRVVRKLKQSIKILAVSLGVVIFYGTPANAVYCEGKISQFYTDSGGNFVILPTFRGDWVQICSVGSEWKGISLTTCNTWIATVISGMSLGKTFMIEYPDLNDCSQIPSYSNASAPHYVRLMQ